MTSGASVGNADRRCVNCDGVLSGRATRYCSPECQRATFLRAQAARRPTKEIANCKNCGKELAGRQTEWCSISCKREFGTEVILLNDIEVLTRKCTGCGLRKPLATEFYPTPTGYRRACRACVMAGNDARNAKPDAADKRRNQHLMGLYGISSQQYEQLLQSQGGTCAICKKPPLRKRLSVDHDHVSGAIRGLLCNYCNLRVVGKVRESSLYRAAADYIDNPPAAAILMDHFVPAGKKSPRRRRPRGRRKQ